MNHTYQPPGSCCKFKEVLRPFLQWSLPNLTRWLVVVILPQAIFQSYVLGQADYNLSPVCFHASNNLFIRSNTQSWNYESWICFTFFFYIIYINIYIGSFCLFWFSNCLKQINPNSKFRGKIRILRFRIGCLIWWTSLTNIYKRPKWVEFHPESSYYVIFLSN